MAGERKLQLKQIEKLQLEELKLKRLKRKLKQNWLESLRNLRN